MDTILFSPDKASRAKKNFETNSKISNNFESTNFINNAKQSPNSHYKSSFNKKRGFYLNNDFCASNKSKMSSDAYDVKDLKELFKKDSAKNHNNQKLSTEGIKEDLNGLNELSISLISNAENKPVKEIQQFNNFNLNYSDDSIFFTANALKNELFDYDLFYKNKNNNSDFSSFDEKNDFAFQKKNSEFKSKLSGFQRNKNYFSNSNFNYLLTDENAPESYRTSLREEYKKSYNNNPYNTSKNRKTTAHSSNNTNKWKDNFLSEIKIPDKISEKVESDQIENKEEIILNNNNFNYNIDKNIKSNFFNEHIQNTKININENNHPNFSIDCKNNFDFIKNDNLNYPNFKRNLNPQPVGFYSNYKEEPQKNYQIKNSPNKLHDIVETSKEEKSMIASNGLVFNNRGSLVEINKKSITDNYAENINTIPLTKNYENEILKSFIPNNGNTSTFANNIKYNEQIIKSDFKTFYDKDNVLYNTDNKQKLAAIEISNKKLFEQKDNNPDEYLKNFYNNLNIKHNFKDKDAKRKLSDERMITDTKEIILSEKKLSESNPKKANDLYFNAIDKPEFKDAKDKFVFSNDIASYDNHNINNDKNYSFKNIYLNQRESKDFSNINNVLTSENLIKKDNQNVFDSNLISNKVSANINFNVENNNNFVFSNATSVVANTNNFVNKNEKIINAEDQNFISSKPNPLQRKDSACSYISGIAVDNSFSSKIKDNQINTFNNNDNNNNNAFEENKIFKKKPSIYLSTEENKNKEQNYFSKESLKFITYDEPKFNQRFDSNEVKNFKTIDNHDTDKYRINSKYFVDSVNSNNMVSSLNSFGEEKDPYDVYTKKNNSKNNYKIEEVIKGLNNANIPNSDIINPEITKKTSSSKINVVKSTNFSKPPMYSNKYISGNTKSEIFNHNKKIENSNSNQIFNQYNHLSKNLNPTACENAINNPSFTETLIQYKNEDYKDNLSNYLNNNASKNMPIVESKNTPTILYYSGTYSNYNYDNKNQNDFIGTDKTNEKYQATTNYLNTIPTSNVYNIKGSINLENGSYVNPTCEGILNNNSNITKITYINPSIEPRKTTTIITESNNIKNTESNQPLNTISYANHNSSNKQNMIKNNDYKYAMVNTVESTNINDNLSKKYLDNLNHYNKETLYTLNFNQNQILEGKLHNQITSLTPTNNHISQNKYSLSNHNANFQLFENKNYIFNDNKAIENNYSNTPNDRTNYYNTLNKPKEYSRTNSIQRATLESINSIYAQENKTNLNDNYYNLNNASEFDFSKLKNEVESYKNKLPSSDLYINKASNKLNNLTFNNENNITSSSNKNANNPSYEKKYNDNFIQNVKINQPQKHNSDINKKDDYYFSNYIFNNYSNPNDLYCNINKESSQNINGISIFNNKSNLNTISNQLNTNLEKNNYSENQITNKYSNKFLFNNKDFMKNNVELKPSEYNYNVEYDNNKYSQQKENLNRKLNYDISNDYIKSYNNEDYGFKNQIVSTGKTINYNNTNVVSQKINSYQYNNGYLNNDKFITYRNTSNKNSSQKFSNLNIPNYINDHLPNQNYVGNPKIESNIETNKYNYNKFLESDLNKQNSDKKLTYSNSIRDIDSNLSKETARKNEYISLNKRIIKYDNTPITNNANNNLNYYNKSIYNNVNNNNFGDYVSNINTHYDN